MFVKIVAVQNGDITLIWMVRIVVRAISIYLVACGNVQNAVAIAAKLEIQRRLGKLGKLRAAIDLPN